MEAYAYFAGNLALEQAAFLEYVLAQSILVFQQDRVEPMLRHALQSLVRRLLLALTLQVNALLALNGIQQALHHLHACRHSADTHTQQHNAGIANENYTLLKKAQL